MLTVVVILPRHPTGWNSVAQELGEHLKCDPADFCLDKLPGFAGKLPGGSK